MLRQSSNQTRSGVSWVTVFLLVKIIICMDFHKIFYSLVVLTTWLCWIMPVPHNLKYSEHSSCWSWFLVTIFSLLTAYITRSSPMFIQKYSSFLLYCTEQILLILLRVLVTSLNKSDKREKSHTLTHPI